MTFLIPRVCSYTLRAGQVFIPRVSHAFTRKSQMMGCLQQRYNIRHLSTKASKVRRGDIFRVKPLVEARTGDVAKSKRGRRPAVVVSSKRAMEETDSVMLARLSSAIKRMLPFEVQVPATKQTGLKKPSKVMPNQLFTVDKDAFKGVKRTGRLSRPDMQRVTDALTVTFSPHYRPRSTQKFSRGDVVDVGGRKGVIVSNDLGNRTSRIVMMSRSSSSPSGSSFEVPVRTQDEARLTVHCGEVDTFDQSSLRKIDKVPQHELARIDAALFEALGIDESGGTDS